MKRKISFEDTALVVVDMLYDFIDGSLACENADNAVAETLKFLQKADKAMSGGVAPDAAEIANSYPILFIRDNHPADHSSFVENGGIWPPHCVHGTRGAEIHDDLKPYVCEELSFYKGCDRSCEQYSGFEGRNESGQSLAEVLELLDIQNVYVCGIATEYCVRNTCMDLLHAGFKVCLLSDCLAWVNRDDHLAALSEMRSSGITVL
ncbi:MAG: isochorismatase family protein [Bacteroidales bacterium]|nr:isochorismatase family protein [Bacteroidales bacterium]